MDWLDTRMLDKVADSYHPIGKATENYLSQMAMERPTFEAFQLTGASLPGEGMIKSK